MALFSGTEFQELRPFFHQHHYLNSRSLMPHDEKDFGLWRTVMISIKTSLQELHYFGKAKFNNFKKS